MSKSLAGIDGSNPLGFMAALGLHRILSARVPEARLRWELTHQWTPVLEGADDVDIVEEVMADLAWWRDEDTPAMDFAVDAERKVQDLKHPPEAYRAWMHEALEAADPTLAEYVAAYATGVVVDGSGQTKPTSFHFAAGNQRFMDTALELRRELVPADIDDIVSGEHQGREGVKHFRWNAGSERLRALASFNPSKTKDHTYPGLSWLAFHALPSFPVVPSRGRVRTPGFVGFGRDEQFRWPLWDPPLHMTEIFPLLQRDAASWSPRERRARGVAVVLECQVLRAGQGYGNFAPSTPV